MVGARHCLTILVTGQDRVCFGMVGLESEKQDRGLWMENGMWRRIKKIVCSRGCIAGGRDRWPKGQEREVWLT